MNIRFNGGAVEEKVNIKHLKTAIEHIGWKLKRKSQQHIKIYKTDDVFLNYYPSSGKLFDRSSCVHIITSHDISELEHAVQKAHRDGLSKSDHETDYIPANADCVVYTDGSTSAQNLRSLQGNMGYAAVVSKNGKLTVWSEQGIGTNNLAELKAIELGLKRANGSIVAIVTDSQLARGWCNGTLRSKNENVNKIISNIKANERLFSGVLYIKVKGHTGEPANEMSDTYARLAASGITYSGVEFQPPQKPVKRRKKNGRTDTNSVSRV